MNIIYMISIFRNYLNLFLFFFFEMLGPKLKFEPSSPFYYKSNLNDDFAIESDSHLDI